MGLKAKLSIAGKTPWQTLGARLYVEVRDNEDSKFIKVGKRPARFFLKERQSELSAALVKSLEKEEAKKPQTKAKALAPKKKKAAK